MVVLSTARRSVPAVRYSTAVALLKSGVDFATISQWLGHAGLDTTMRYARADLERKWRVLPRRSAG
jgi:site-specific recombinase XerD